MTPGLTARNASRNSIACHAVPSPAIDITVGYHELADIQILRAHTPHHTRENVIRPVGRETGYTYISYTINGR